MLTSAGSGGIRQIAGRANREDKKVIDSAYGRQVEKQGSKKGQENSPRESRFQKEADEESSPAEQKIFSHKGCSKKEPRAGHRSKS
jgi:hypothetical protein